MIFQFSDGEFSDRIALSLKMWEKINSFTFIIVSSDTLEKLNRNPQAICVVNQTNSNVKLAKITHSSLT